MNLFEEHTKKSLTGFFYFIDEGSIAVSQVRNHVCRTI